MAIVLSKLFMRTISQTSTENQTGISLWTLEDVKKAQEKQRLLLEAQERDERQNGDIGMETDAGDNSDAYGDGGIPDDLLEGMDIDQ
jgi:DNA excision repair protein ERCC-2